MTYEFVIKICDPLDQLGAFVAQWGFLRTFVAQVYKIDIDI